MSGKSEKQRMLGGGAILCPGVTIGAGSVAAGNPCRVVRELPDGP